MKEYEFDMKAYQFDIEKHQTSITNTIVLSQISYVRILILYEKCHSDMFENIKMVWQHKVPKFICKNTRLMTSVGILLKYNSSGNSSVSASSSSAVAAK